MKKIISTSGIFLICFFVFFSTASFAQEESSPEGSKSTISISGEIGAYGELYNISNIPNRRPNSTGRLFLRPTLDILGLLQIPFEIFLSTEGSSARQNLNQFGINPKWDWGSAHLGDFNEDFSKFTLNGIKIRGGGLNINPGIFRFSTAAGFTNKAVNGGAQNGAYDRFLLAAKLGVGKEDETNFNLIILKAKDKVSSIDQDKKSITVLEPNGDDNWPIGSLQTIRWTSVNVAGAVTIEISRDGGTTFEQVQTDVPNTGFYDWSVTGPVTFQALIKITDAEDASVSDISDYIFSIGTGSEFIYKKGNRTTDVSNPNSVTPQENLVIGISGKVKFYESTVVLDYEADGSLYSRDLRASELDPDSAIFPEFFLKIFTPRVGSDYDFAFNTALNLNLKSYSGKIGYKRVGPGYNSLGLSYLLNDHQEIIFNNTFRISKFALMLGYINLTDNLNNQKLFTTSRNIYTAGISGSISEKWNTSLMLNLLDMGNDSNADSTKTDFNNIVVSTTQSFLVGQKTLFRTISFTYVFQASGNKSYQLTKNTTQTHTINAGVNLFFNENLNSTVSAGLVNSTVFDTLKNTTTNFSLVLQHSAFERKLNPSLNLSAAFGENTDSYRSGLTASYNLTNSDTFTIALWFTRFNGAAESGQSFSEILSGFNYSHRF
ncbi:MAG: hypothetical protein Kow0098_15250 [Ignavibacteriaceae bacterium]